MRDLRGAARQLARAAGRRVLGVAPDRHEAYSGLRYRAVPSRYEPPTEEVETWFTTEAGKRLAVERGYRYGLKQGWLMYPSLRGLRHLRARGLLGPQEETFLSESIGHRTLTRALDEIDAVAQPVIARHATLWEPGTVEPGRFPVPTPDAAALRRDVDAQMAQFRYRFRKLEESGHFVPRAGMRTIEVGCGRGLASAALARLSFRAVGIDNNYHDNFDSGGGTWRILREMAGTALDLRLGDITKGICDDAGSFDIILSTSVLEHVGDLPAALAEMHRLLADGGFMIHGYNPFFSLNGGHALGILDTPWGHARLSEADYLRYFDQLRPFEAATARRWVSGALNRNLTIAAMQRSLTEAGFCILSWEESSGKLDPAAHLTPDVLADAQETCAEITLADLLATDVQFVAAKR